jgi:hypothetical protein
MRKSGWSRRRVARALSRHEYPMRRSLAGYLCTFFVGIAVIVSQNASRNCFLSSTHLESRTIRVLRSSCPLGNLFLGSTAPLTQRFTKIPAIDFSSPGLAYFSRIALEVGVFAGNRSPCPSPRNSQERREKYRKKKGANEQMMYELNLNSSH